MVDGLLADSKETFQRISLYCCVSIITRKLPMALVQRGQVKMIIDAHGESVQDRQGFVTDKPLPSLLMSDAAAL
jgi:hypothetical protein